MTYHQAHPFAVGLLPFRHKYKTHETGKDAPNYHALRMDDFDFARRSITDDGRLLGMYGVQPVGSLSFWSPVARTDWVGDLDPYTYDDWHELLVSFRDEHNCPRPYMLDPNGQDTYMMAGFNVGASWIVIDGEVRHSITEDGYVEYLNQMRQWYEEGLINSSFYKVTRTQEETEDYSFIMSDIETRINETIVHFITGEKSMDEWDAFLDELNGMGLDDARQIQQQAYDRFMAR